jgi:uncharacterized membrane protein
VTAFITIASMWLNHHALFDRVTRIDKPLAWTNLLLLLTVFVLPFPTFVVAAYVSAGGIDAMVAVSSYGLIFVVNGLTWTRAWHHPYRIPDLLNSPFDGTYAALELRRTIIGIATYTTATAVAFIAPVVALVLYRTMARTPVPDHG